MVGKDCHLYGEEYSIKSMELENDVVFPGLVDQEDLPAFYNLADLYLYPTIIEAFPIPTTEAMVCGCPIVTSHDTGLQELTGDAAVHVDPKDPVQIADAIDQVLNVITRVEEKAHSSMMLPHFFMMQKQICRKQLGMNY
ncbi:MAG: glycosyltransferase [Bacteroidetes bacterium]|nr:glycosyltransferase [Bacteroidota bacterium]